MVGVGDRNRLSGLCRIHGVSSLISDVKQRAWCRRQVRSLWRHPAFPSELLDCHHLSSFRALVVGLTVRRRSGQK